MHSIDRLNRYLRALEVRLRLEVVARGAAAIALIALGVTFALVLATNALAFSVSSVAVARVLLIISLAVSVGFVLLAPLLRLSRKKAASQAEQRFPEFQQRLITFAERTPDANSNAFVDLLAEDTIPVAEALDPGLIAPSSRMAGFAAASAAALGTLLWLVLAGPGFLGHGAALLWAGTSRTGSQPFYDIAVSPGDAKVRRGGDQLVNARLVGFETKRAKLLVRYRGTTKWEEASMQPSSQGGGFEFLFAGLAESAEYYAAAGAIRSKTFTLSVVDLPTIKKMRVTYQYPAWTGLKDTASDSGDLRAVEGTRARVEVLTDRLLANGVLALDEGANVPLQLKEGNWFTANVDIQKDGLYHVAALEQGQRVRLSEDFFIEAQKETPPQVRIAQPGRDARVNPIEEVTVAVEAEDDFALYDLSIRYSVNGGEEKTVPLLARKGLKKAEGGATIYLEDFKLVPGDIASVYAAARDALHTSNTDMLFIEAQPFEKEFSQSQQSGGGEGGEGQGQNRISDRQKEIIAATWNQIRDRAPDPSTTAENARFLSDVQTKLRDQAQSLAARMGRRQLSGATEELSSFGKDMEAAAEDMGTAAGKLKARGWRDALAPEQRALQHLLRAEATYRQIQVAFGSRGGGAGGRGAGRDLENLFDLELDTEKNQYETGQQRASGEQRNREVDEALQKLEQLARRQQELAQQRQNRQNFQQRWQQDMLRREAEQLQRQMQQLLSGAGPSASRGQQQDPRLRQALERLEQATRDMRRADQQSDAEARRAAERLQEARDILRGLRSQESRQQLDELAAASEGIAVRQRDLAGRIRQQYGHLKPGEVAKNADRKRDQQLAWEKERIAGEYQRLERALQDATRELAAGQRSASSKLRDALGELQKEEVGLKLKYGAEWIRRGYGSYALPREESVTSALEGLRDRLREAQSAMNRGGAKPGDVEQALAQVERLRGQLDGMSRGGEQSAINRGDVRAPEPGAAEAPAPSEIERSLRQGVRDLASLRSSLRENPEMVRDLDELVREMQRLDPKQFPGNPELVERLRSQVLPGLEQLEIQLRRQLDASAGQPRYAGSEPAPPGYADRVAEYFRRLSRSPQF